MKKVLLILLIVVLTGAIGLGVFTWWSYEHTTDEGLVAPRISIDGQEMSPVKYTWHEPVLGGLMHKSFSAEADMDPDLGEVSAAPEIVMPEGYACFFTLWRDGAQLFSGAPDAWDSGLAAGPGAYELTAVAEKPQGDGGFGTFEYLALFTVPAPPEPEPEPEAAVPSEPEFIAGRTELQQGDVFAMRVMYLPEGVRPEAETSLGNAIFTPIENGWFAAVAVGNVREPGTYPVRVAAGDHSWEATVTVEPFEFDLQDLIIDESDPDVSEANSPAAIQQYNDVMLPMYQTWDEERYWDGLFIRPAEGWISTQFGEIRTTNGDPSSARPHWGMDIAAAEGADVIAPNRGRVVFADYLLAVGYTVIIEHGGGLKSYYYHMSALECEEGQMVEQGQLIGKVGSTGYSTGPHLHFEMRLGGREQVISPSMLWDENAGLYSTGEAEADPAA